VVELLLSHGANINRKTTWGWSSLMKASYNGHTRVVDILLNHGANIHDKTAVSGIRIVMRILISFV
jgi:ankyrin repeat protein